MGRVERSSGSELPLPSLASHRYQQRLFLFLRGCYPQRDSFLSWRSSRSGTSPPGDDPVQPERVRPSFHLSLSAAFRIELQQGRQHSADSRSLPSRNLRLRSVSAYKTHLITFERDRTRPTVTSTDPPPSPSLITVAVESAKEAETTIALVAVAIYQGWQNHVS